MAYLVSWSDPHAMKHLLALAAIGLGQMAAGQWQLSSYLTDDPNDLFAANADTVVITDGNGRLVRTLDGGGTWSAFQTEFVNSWFLAVHFPTAAVGYACGGTAFGEYKNCIAKTTDGGLTWDTLTSNAYPGYEFRDIHFVNEATGFVAGDTYSGLMKTTDGGDSFLPVGGGVLPRIQAIEFITDQIGFVTSWQYDGAAAVTTIQRTTDQGGSWETVYSDEMATITGLDHRRINAIQFVDAQNGFAVGGNGTFLRTTDGGFNWESSVVPPGSSDLTALWFTSAQVGYTNTAGTISRTADGGASWAIQSVVPVSLARKVMMLTEDLGYAITDDGVYKTGNAGGANAVGEQGSSLHFHLYPNPVSNRLFIRGLDRTTTDRMEVVNMMGEIMLVLEGNHDEIDVQALPVGMYTLIVMGRNALAKQVFIVTGNGK